MHPAIHTSTSVERSWVKSGEKVTRLTALWSVFLRRVGEDDAPGWEEWSRDRRGYSWMDSMLAFCECGVKGGNGVEV